MIMDDRTGSLHDTRYSKGKSCSRDLEAWPETCLIGPALLNKSVFKNDELGT